MEKKKKTAKKGERDSEHPKTRAGAMGETGKTTKRSTFQGKDQKMGAETKGGLKLK